jgi:putative membrane protein
MKHAMKLACLAAVAAASEAAGSAWAQGTGQMHDWGMWLGPLFMIVLLALVIAGIVALVRWVGGDGGGRVRTAREILDERYARGEIDREEYQRRRDDIAGRP